ncbi:hypothetical protein [Streptomyces sp. NPDC055140]
MTNWRNPASHPHLCGDCQGRAVAVERQAEADERDRQEQERLRRELEQGQDVPEADGWLSRFRT